MRKVETMSNTTENIMKDVCELSLQVELQKIAELDISKIVYQSLSAEQINQLARKIGLLPFEYRSILFFRYCFNNTPSETNKILEIENAKSKLRYIQKMLSCFMGLENSWVDDKSMKEACQLALTENMKDYDNIEILHKPNYSNAFRRKLKDIKIVQSHTTIFRLIAKRAAIFILVCIISFSAVLAVNAEAREKFFDWIIETFPKFSIFTHQGSEENNNSVELTSLKINYIPKGFELTDTKKGRKMLIYNYVAKDNQKLTILFASSGYGKSYYDTENVKMEEFNFKESKAYIWQTDKMTYLIWQQDGIECRISGNLNKDEILKVAENISK